MDVPQKEVFEVNPTKIVVLLLFFILLLSAIAYVSYTLLKPEKQPEQLNEPSTSSAVEEKKQEEKEEQKQSIESKPKEEKIPSLSPNVHYIYLFDNYVNSDYIKVKKNDIVVFKNEGHNVKAIRLDWQLNITNQIYPQKSWNITVDWIGLMPWKDSFNFYVRGVIESEE